ncbi:MAG TPA: pentapeptide repeat-containing protein, partial [Microlunatus sp.]
MPTPTVPRPPRIPTRRPAVRREGDGEALLDGDSYAAERYGQVDLTDRDLRHSTFSECTFAGATLTGADLTGAHLVESD